MANRSSTSNFPVVCIGLSAGGVPALKELFRAVAPATGMAFVIIHHLSRERPTGLVSILAHCSPMPSQLAQPDRPIQPNNIYVLPSGDEMELLDGSFSIQPRSKLRGWPNLVSIFIDSMAQSGHPGIAVILSGMDADGAAALSKLKAHGGIVIAQAPATAWSPDMPRAAIRTGAVDYVLAPAAIGSTLTQLAGVLQVQRFPEIEARPNL